MDGYHVDGRKIRALRERRGHKQAPFARLAGIGRSQLKRIEGPVGDPTAPTFQPSAPLVHRIATALDVDISEFCEPVEQRDHQGAA